MCYAIKIEEWIKKEANVLIFKIWGPKLRKKKLGTKIAHFLK
jgi:hypothetical protein